MEVKDICVKSNKNNLSKILSEINTELEPYSINMKLQLQLELIIEELFLNICSYAYETEEDILIQYNISDNPLKIIINFIDNGVPFNPLTKDAPDLSLSADEREIGGLGLAIVRKNVDDIKYKYENNQNILTIQKYF